MKVLAINSSPRSGKQSKTELMLNNLVRGMRDAGAEVEVVALREKKIENCIGCFTCWTNTPGTCIHQDDMTNEVFPKWQEADLVIYATPLYHYTMTGTMKTFIERTLPGLEPFFDLGPKRMFHPPRYNENLEIVVLSVSGMPDESHFGPLSAHVNYLFATPGRKLVAEIYRATAELMNIPFFREKADNVLKATVQAGQELIRSRKISPETMAKITQPFIDGQSFVELGNAIFKTCIAQGVPFEEFKEREMVPRPYSLNSFLFLFPLGIDAKAVADRKVVLQFTFSGEIEDACFFTIENGSVAGQKGTWNSPDLTVEAPFNVWADIMTGMADGRQMLMEQKYKVSGDLALMAQLFQKG